MKYGKILLTLLLCSLLCSLLCLTACGAPADRDNALESASLPGNAVGTQPEADDKVHYTVTVLGDSGEPIPGALVQLCTDVCYPGRTDETGAAGFDVPADDYKVGLLSLPDGYIYADDVQEFYFEPGSTDLTIVLAAADG